MAGSVFIIQELQAEGSKARRQAIRFVWNRQTRNIPYQPWEMPLALRTKRTDYPGRNMDPTEQVLGANFEDFTLSGRWADKHNYPGYANDTMVAFEELVQSGNLVQITFEDIFVVGLIKHFVPSYRRRALIHYSFTVSPHHRKPVAVGKRSPRTVLNASQLQLEVEAIRDAAVELHERAPRFFTTGSLYGDVADYLDAWESAIKSIDDTINQRVVLPDYEPGTAMRRLAALFRLLKTNGFALSNDLLRTVRSDTDLGLQTAATIMDFDVWAKGLSYEALRMTINGERAARELEERADPSAIALYRPHAGEHLYGISNRFYNTPWNWRRIATRNSLGNELVLNGTELLVIPEATAR